MRADWEREFQQHLAEADQQIAVANNDGCIWLMKIVGILFIIGVMIF